MDTTVTESALISRPLFWAKQIHICEEKHLEKSIHQARCNPDYKIAHPAECRNMPKGGGLHNVHPEAKVRILKELANKIKSVNPPKVKRPERWNRS